MTFTNAFYERPKALRIRKPVESVNLIVHGQGVIIFDATKPCHIILADISGTAGLIVNFTNNKVLVNMYPDNEPLIDHRNTKGLSNVAGAYYWFSIDSQNLRLYAPASCRTALYGQGPPCSALCGPFWSVLDWKNYIRTGACFKLC